MGSGTAPPRLLMGENHKKGDIPLNVSSKNKGFRALSKECADANWASASLAQHGDSVRRVTPRDSSRLSSLISLSHGWEVALPLPGYPWVRTIKKGGTLP